MPACCHCLALDRHCRFDVRRLHRTDCRPPSMSKSKPKQPSTGRRSLAGCCRIRRPFIYPGPEANPTARSNAFNTGTNVIPSLREIFRPSKTSNALETRVDVCQGNVLFLRFIRTGGDNEHKFLHAASHLHTPTPQPRTSCAAYARGHCFLSCIGAFSRASCCRMAPTRASPVPRVQSNWNTRRRPSRVAEECEKHGLCLRARSSQQRPTTSGQNSSRAGSASDEHESELARRLSEGCEFSWPCKVCDRSCTREPVRRGDRIRASARTFQARLTPATVCCPWHTRDPRAAYGSPTILADGKSHRSVSTAAMLFVKSRTAG